MPKAAFLLAVAMTWCALHAPALGQTLYPQPAEVVWTQPTLRAGTPPQPLGSPEEIKRRYELAWKLVEARDYGGALAEFVWLWDATADTSTWGSLYRTSVIQSIGRVAPYHEPTHQLFVTLLDELEQFVRSQESPRSYREWGDWTELSRALGQEERLIRLYEERRKPDGSIDTSALHFSALQGVTEVLLERGRFADVGRMEADLVDAVQWQLKSTDFMLEMDPDGFDSKQEIEASRHDDRQQVALLYATGLAAGRAAECQQVAELLLAQYDSVDSRRELVLACLRVGVVPDTVPRWIAELKERGEDVTDLTTALMDATHK